jgi:nucleoside-diphosphate-sugar epimerase
MTTLIIGCGYLGQRVGRLLSASGERVFGTIRSEAGAATIAELGIEPILADVLNLDSLRGLPAAERVFYCVGFDRSTGLPMRSVYVDGLSNVLDCPLFGVSRIVYASSTGVYGQALGEWVDEATPAAPRNESGRICLEAEERLMDWAKRGNARDAAVVLRFVGLYGPGRVVRRTLIEEGHPIPGDPDKLLNLIHIDDAASAAVAALAIDSLDPLYLVSDDRPVTRDEYYSLTASLLGAPAPRFVIPNADSLEEARDATNKRVVNRRMKAGLGVKLLFPDISTGLPAALFTGDREPAD